MIRRVIGTRKAVTFIVLVSMIAIVSELLYRAVARGWGGDRNPGRPMPITLDAPVGS
jgi:hypothetical protein